VCEYGCKSAQLIVKFVIEYKGREENLIGGVFHKEVVSSFRGRAGDS